MQSTPRPDTAATMGYAMAELYEVRRLVVIHARTAPPGPERNQHRQIARSIRRLFGDATWLANHTIGDLARICDRCTMQMTHLADLRSFGVHPAERIYRCYHCNHVVSERR